MNSLNEKMARYQHQFESGETPFTVSNTQIELMRRFDTELTESDVLKYSLRPGDHFPAFALENQYGEVVELNNLVIRGPVVITFFRGNWCPYCNLELESLQSVLDDLEASGASMIAISPQLRKFNKLATHQNALRFDVLSDVNNAVANQIGITHTISERERKKVYAPMDVNLPLFNGDDSWQLPIASRYVVDRNRLIVSVDAAINHKRRVEPRETLMLVKAITRRFAI